MLRQSTTAYSIIQFWHPKIESFSEAILMTYRAKCQSNNKRGDHFFNAELVLNEFDLLLFAFVSFYANQHPSTNTQEILSENEFSFCSFRPFSTVANVRDAIMFLKERTANRCLNPCKKKIHWRKEWNEKFFLSMRENELIFFFLFNIQFDLNEANQLTRFDISPFLNIFL